MASSLVDRPHGPVRYACETSGIELVRVEVGDAGVLSLTHVPRFSRTTFLRSPLTVSAGGLRFGGEMLLKIALVLLAVWLIGVLGVYDIGDAVHIFLLVGGMLLLLGFVKAREAAIAATRHPKEP